MILDLWMLDAHHLLDCDELKAVLSLNILFCIYPDFDSFFMKKINCIRNEMQFEKQWVPVEVI